MMVFTLSVLHYFAVVYKSPPDLKLIKELGPNAVICLFLSGSALMNMEGQREKGKTEKLTIHKVKYK